MTRPILGSLLALAVLAGCATAKPARWSCRPTVSAERPIGATEAETANIHHALAAGGLTAGITPVVGVRCEERP